MSLVGPWFASTAVVVTVLGFAAAVRWWPRWSGPGPRAVLSRIAVLGGVNLLALLTAAVLVNDEFQFFTDWNDLLGATGQVTIAYGGANADPAVDDPFPGAVRPAPPPDGRSFPASNGRSGTAPNGRSGTAPDDRPDPGYRRPIPAGMDARHRVRTFTVTGRRSRIRAEVVVELPPAYFDPTRSDRRFPVIETFHGYPGRPSQWVAGMALGRVWAQLRDAHQVDDAIIVSPDVEYPSGVDSECVDGGARGPQVETWAGQDVPDWVLSTFRARSARQSWATIGLSAGGWCAALVTMHHPDRYSAGIVMGGYFRPQFSRYVPFGPDSAAGRADDLVQLAATAPPPVALWLQTSKADQLSYATSQALILAARPPLAVQATVLSNAGHRFSLWRSMLPQALQWLGRTVPGFAPTSPAS